MLLEALTEHYDILTESVSEEVEQILTEMAHTTTTADKTYNRQTHQQNEAHRSQLKKRKLEDLPEEKRQKNWRMPPDQELEPVTPNQATNPDTTEK